jgi:hypothetical protein
MSDEEFRTKISREPSLLHASAEGLADGFNIIDIVGKTVVVQRCIALCTKLHTLVHEVVLLHAFHPDYPCALLHFLIRGCHESVL